jgi:hypothetical protein
MFAAEKETFVLWECSAAAATMIEPPVESRMAASNERV